MSTFKRGGIAAAIVVSSALVAIGCGGSDSKAASAAKDAAALDLVPKSALGYATLDVDFDGEQWKQFDKLATAFKDDFKGVEAEISDETDTEDGAKWADVEAWIGDSAGAALTSVSDDGKTAEGFFWVDVKDKGKFEEFAEKENLDKGDTVGDYDVWTDTDDKTAFGVSDDTVLVAEDAAKLRTHIEFDGDSISDAEGLDDVVDEGEDEALVTVVVNGAGVRDTLKDNEQFKSVSGAVDLSDFRGAVVSIAAKEEGFSVHGHVKGLSKDGKNHANDLFSDLPADTLVAFGGHDLGGTLKTTVESAGKENPQVQQTLGAMTGVIGVDLDDLAAALNGEFALALSADDAALGQLAGGVAGAAMGGGLSGVDPSQLVTAGNITLAFENGDTTVETLDKITGAIGGLTGSPPKPGTAGDFETKTFTAGGLPITAASSDDVAAIAVGKDVFTTWGDNSLADSDSFKDAWAAAGAPDDVAASMWLDWGRVAGLLDVKSADDVKAGGWVGWVEADGDAADFDVFMHISES
ncbi:MAG: hypothetical protein JWO69_1015 [Thermoleophilia bacterium]|nr:hypothetical protein [Thermoleophilia bacterium]